MQTDLQLSPWSVSGTGNGWDDDFFESIFFLGNGRMGIRGYLPMEPEDRPIQKGVYLAGIFGEIKPGITDFVNLPTPVYDSILLDGEAGTLSSPIERSLDMKAACFTARFSLTAKRKTVDIVYSRFLPREHPALILQRLKFLPHENVEISDETVLNGVDGRVLDMTVKLKVTDAFKKFTIKLAADETYDSTITYDPVREVLSLDRSRSGYMYDILHTRDIQVKPADGEVTLRILMDRFSVEIFINDGSQTATMVLFTPQEADNISFAADGKAQISVDKYALTF